MVIFKEPLFKIQPERSLLQAGSPKGVECSCLPSLEGNPTTENLGPRSSALLSMALRGRALSLWGCIADTPASNSVVRVLRARKLKDPKDQRLTLSEAA